MILESEDIEGFRPPKLLYRLPGVSRSGVLNCCCDALNGDAIVFFPFSAEVRTEIRKDWKKEYF